MLLNTLNYVPVDVYFSKYIFFKFCKKKIYIWEVNGKQSKITYKAILKTLVHHDNLTLLLEEEELYLFLIE